MVYATLDYALMEESPVTIRTLDSSGEPAFETSRQYTGGGRDNVPMSHGGGTWPAGSYVTTIYMTSGDQTGAEIDDGAAGSGGASTAGERPVHSIQWRVAVAPTDEPPLLPPVLPAQGAAAVPTSGAASSWPPDAAGQYPAPGAPVPCSAPFGWYTYVVQPGDTLIGLALRTGVSARRLMTANCMTSTVLYAGATIYVPRPPTRRASPPGPAAPTAPPWPTAWKGYPTPTAVYPPSIPTTWYTPPVATAPVPVDTVVPGAAGQPTPPTEPTAPGSAPPGSSPPAGPGATSVPTTGSLATPTANVPVPTSPPAPTEPAAPPPPTSAGAPAPTNPGPEPSPAPTEAPPQPPAAPPEPSQQPVPTDAPTQAPPAGSQELLRLAR